ncbi:Immunoglobulin-binding protein 1 [Blattella germanica]|nr:Immunoglobulin-binding protein 1 [Blattella germanica]
MASASTLGEPAEKRVSQIYDEGMTIYEEISKSSEATNSTNIQAQVKRAMLLFEDVTKLISIGGMFSANESIEEVPTKNIRYLLLPALLGTLSLKLCLEDRMNVVETAEVYFRDFLKRCKSYEVIDYEIPEAKQSESTDSTEPSHSGGMPDLATMARERNAKIQRYKEQKELESILDDLKKTLSNIEITDEELERKYYITLIKNFASQAMDELYSLEMEKPLLEHMAKVRKGENFADSKDNIRKGKFKPRKPLQPIIITRDEIQKKVFGAGYPSLPTMTVQEFYEKRIADGDWPDPSKQKMMSLQDMATMGNTEDRDEREAAEKEEKAERDDPKQLQDARDWDEFKDDHRRGFGNRMNRS